MTQRPRKRGQPGGGHRAGPGPSGDLRAVVGIGASAGGVEALIALFGAMPDDLGAAFLVALHTDPTSESHLREILGRHSKLPFSVVEAPTVPEPDHIYVALPGRMLVLHDGTLNVLDLGGGLPSWPLDALFLSLAEEQGQRAVAVILSGTGSHGVAGAAHVRAEGGLVIIQDPSTTIHNLMPRHAIHAGVADLVLPPERMAQGLADYLRHDYVVQGVREGEDDGRGEERHLEAALSVVHARTGRDFRSYTRPTLVRRMRRRAGLAGCPDLAHYVELLREDEEELRAMADDLTVRVTGFFRDAEAWKVLEEQVVPAIVEERPSGSEIRLWAAGCATGEEPYSLAMLVQEQAERVHKSFDFKVFATDTALDALTIGRAGLYPEGAVEGLSAERLRRFFTPENSAYRVSRGLRDCVVFSPHDLLEAPPFSRMDLVSCRNLLIYLEPEVQARVIGLFHFALHEGGYLVLGKAESVGKRPELFEPVSKKWRIYRKTGPTRHDQVEFPLGVPGAGRGRRERGAAHPSRGSWSERPRERLQEVLLERYAPASVLVDADFRILYFHGATERYLKQPRGEPRQDLLAMAVESLRSAIRRAIRKARTVGSGPSAVEARVEGEGGGVRRVRVVATSLSRSDGGSQPVTLVSFEEAGEAAPREAVREAGEEASLEEVERELHDTREELHSTVEELERSNEELKASNEEITSMNEELQSTNEELQTSKEELQSLNEELSTVNAQLEGKVDELEDATNDLHNLLTSTDIATIFLDTTLRIRMFTPPALRLFNLLPRDVGRQLEDFQAKFADATLLSDCRAVVDSLVPREAEVRGQDERWYARRVHPYRTEDNRIEGVVVTLTDVTTLKQAEAELASLNRELERRVEERTEHIRLLQDVAVIANATSSPERALEKTLERVCEFNGWVAGHVYRLGGSGILRPESVWYVRPEAEELGAAILESVGGATLARGEGLPGQVLAAGAARWSGGPKAREDRRVVALEGAGVAAAVAFPVLVGDEVVAVLEFFSEHPVDLDDGTVEVMANVGTQLGRVVERARLERRLADLTIQEQQRLGEELHEGLGQQVTGVAVLARSLHKKLDDAGRPEAELAAQLVEHLRAARSQVRDLAKGLLPVRVHERGLEAALAELVDEICVQYGADCRLDIDGIDVRDERLATSLYRIAREAVNNAILHAEAKTIGVRIHRQEGGIVLEVTDDGKGFREDRVRKGLGLKIMRDRASLVGGDLTIGERDGGGTRVRCTIPEGGRGEIG